MDKLLPHSPQAEDLQMIEMLLFGDRRELAARGFELEESPDERRISRTIRLPEEPHEDDPAGKARRTGR